MLKTGISSEKNTGEEALTEYCNSVQALGEKLGRIARGKKEIAGNLSRAAAALRSMAAANTSQKTEKTPVII